MSGPVVRPSDVKSPVPSMDESFAAMNAPTDALIPGQVTDSEDAEEQQYYQQALAQLEGGSASQQAAPTDALDAEEAQYYQQAVASLGQPQPQPSAPIAPVGGVPDSSASDTGILGAVKSAIDFVAADHTGPNVPVMARIASNIPTNPVGQAMVLKKQLGAGYDTRIKDGRVQWTTSGSNTWNDLTPKQLKSLKDTMSFALDFIPTVAEGLVVGAASTVGMLGGAAVGSTVPGPGTVAGAFAGGFRGGAVASAGTTAIRESAAQLLGDTSKGPLDVIKEMTVSGLFGGLMTGVTEVALRKPLQFAADTVAESVKVKSDLGKAARLGDVQTAFQNMFGYLTGKSRSSIGEAGQEAAALARQGMDALGDSISLVWNTLQTASKGSRFVPTQMMDDVGRALGEYYEFVPSVKSGRMEWRPLAGKKIPSDVRGYLARLENIWTDLSSNKGVTFKEYEALLQKTKSYANYNSDNPSILEQAWQTLNKGFARERDDILEHAAKGTEVESLVASTFKKYRDNIDVMAALAAKAEKDPRAFANAVFQNTDNVVAARNALKLTEGGTQAFDTFKATWLDEIISRSKDAKTGIVDLRKMHDILAVDKLKTDTILGEGSAAQLQRLATQMDKITWQGILHNPDSMSSLGVIRALGKWVGSGFDGGFGAGVIGSVAQYNPEIIKLVQEKGILQFAKESKTMIERSKWLRISEGLNRILNATQVHNGRYVVPVERFLVPKLVNAGLRTYNEPPMASEMRVKDAKAQMEEYLSQQPLASPQGQ